MNWTASTKKQLSRFLWHLNRSPARHAVKSALRLGAHQHVRRRRELITQLPQSTAITSAAATLNAQGWVQVDDLVDAQALQQLAAAGAAKLERAQAGNVRQDAAHKFFWTRLLDEDKVDGRMPTTSPFVQFALQPAVISALASALGELPRLDYVLLTLSQWSEQPLALSQLWHRDHDDVRTLKLFTYLTDVNSQNDGPFTFIPGPQSDQFGFSLRSHRPDAEVFTRLQPSHVHSMLAPRLSTFIVETSRCLHMGSRLAPHHSRLMYTATYISSPRMYPEPVPQFLLSGTENEIERRLLIPDRRL